MATCMFCDKKNVKVTMFDDMGVCLICKKRLKDWYKVKEYLEG